MTSIETERSDDKLRERIYSQIFSRVQILITAFAEKWAKTDLDFLIKRRPEVCERAFQLAENLASSLLSRPENILTQSWITGSKIFLRKPETTRRMLKATEIARKRLSESSDYFHKQYPSLILAAEKYPQFDEQERLLFTLPILLADLYLNYQPNSLDWWKIRERTVLPALCAIAKVTQPSQKQY